MAVIKNTWVEKEKKKAKAETAPAFQSNDEDTWAPVKKKVKREITSSNATMRKTLRGVRK